MKEIAFENQHSLHYPFYKSDMNGQVQIKIISPYEFAVVGVIRNKQYERYFDARNKLDYISLNRYIKFEDSTEENYINLLRQYCDEIRKVQKVFFPE